MNAYVFRWIVVASLAFAPSKARADLSYAFTYGGRLTTTQGSPLQVPLR